VKPAVKLVLFLFCLTMVVLSSQSHAATPPAKQNVTQEDWQYYAADEDGANYLYDKGNVERLKGNMVRVWVQALYPASNQKYSEARFQWELNCSTKKIRGIQAYAKNRDGSKTTVTESSEWSAIPKGSTAETLYGAVCKKTVKKTDNKTEDKNTETKKKSGASDTKTP